MPNIDLDKCIQCGACKIFCPSIPNSISDEYVINNNSCIDCGLCKDMCPLKVII